MLLIVRRRTATTLCAFGVALAILVLWCFGRRPVPVITMRPVAVQFDGQSAIEYARVLALQYPDRVTGSPNARRAGRYIRSELERLGYAAEVLPFTMWLRGERVQGENIVATLAGETPQSTALMAHYDGQTTSHQAAEDNASGVGVLLELARVLRDRPHHRGLILVASDAEEWGMIGARALTHFLKEKNTVAVISIDYLERGRAPGLAMACMGQSDGYTPLWLRELVVEAARSQGVAIHQPESVGEFVERAVEVSPEDQGPLLRAGIPALNLETESTDYAASRARYHTTADVFQNFDPICFRMLGVTVEQAAVTLDRLPPVVSGGMTYLRLSRGRYLAGDELSSLLTLAMLPIIIASLFAGSRLVAESRSWPAALVSPLAYAIPPWLALIVLYVLAAANILKRWELYPATPRDPFLYQIPLRVLVPLLLAFAVGYAMLRGVRARLRAWRPADAEPASFTQDKQALYVWLSFVCLGSFLLNPFAMWFYLGLFAYAALLLVEPRSVASRAYNSLLLLIAALPLLTLLYRFGSEIFLGWRIVWYLVLQAAYGVWSPSAAILFLLAVTLWCRLAAISVLGGPVPRSVA